MWDHLPTGLGLVAVIIVHFPVCVIFTVIVVFQVLKMPYIFQGHHYHAIYYQIASSICYNRYTYIARYIMIV